MTAAPPAPRAIVAARLRQARELRGLSQREVGIRMGLDKDTASARISRYESGAMSISLEALFKLAEALDVPAAYLVASSEGMAAAIELIGKQHEGEQEKLTDLLNTLTQMSPERRDECIRAIKARG
ncbi:helix-turn-helix domain-containing protein [Stenotrophomonas sp. NPDC077659]|uniref:helix-turn-helix domain-containing protein n=1 Tax=Stenotrophomonas sp. NPDC077659 TaxID=3390694 RepID=UPI003CFD3B6E